jgi:glutathione S-transferase
VTTPPTLYGAAHGVLLRAVRRLAGDALTLADLQTTPIFSFLRTAPEEQTVIAACAPIPARWHREAARPGTFTTLSLRERRQACTASTRSPSK